MMRKVEGSVMATLQGVQTFAEVSKATTQGLVSTKGRPLCQSATHNRCSPAQPSLKCLVSGGKSKNPQICNPLPDSGSVVTLVSESFCDAMGI